MSNLFEALAGLLLPIHYAIGSIYRLQEAYTYSFSFMFHSNGLCIFIS